MAIVFMSLIVLMYCAAEVKSVSFDICYMIDQSHDEEMNKHSIEAKLQLARNISRCLLTKKNVRKIAAVVYDNQSATLGFNFKNLSDVLDDEFAQILHRQRIRRSQSESRSDPRASDSPQTMAFLTAAEVLMADESQSHDDLSFFKVLVISDSNSFPVLQDAKDYFADAGVEINALDLSENGNQELKESVTSPNSEHYIHNPSPTDQNWIKDVCAKLVNVPAIQKNIKSQNTTKLLRTPKEKDSSLFWKEALQYQNPGRPSTSSNMFPALDKYIESNSLEYKWSPHPETESSEEDQDESFGPEDKKAICENLHDDCAIYASSGLCNDDPIMKGMKKLCKQTCKFCE